MVLPHPYPAGWYRFRYSHEVAAGQVVAGRFFGRQLVCYRARSGSPHVLQAHCSHLGAHLVDGRVQGDDIQCPFHGWRYDGGGRCTHVPFASAIPDAAGLGSFPVVERNGVIWFWHDTTGAAPWFELPLVPECQSPDWRRRSVHRQVIRSRIQDPRENSVDTAHTPFVHRRSFPVYPGSVPEIRGWAEDPATRQLRFQIVSTVGRQGRPREIKVEFELAGPGYALMRSREPADLLFVVPLTPVDEQHLVFSMMTYVKRSRVPLLNDLLGWLAFRYFLRGLREDYVLFEKKTYLTEPALSDADGPIAELRRWMLQFDPAQRVSVTHPAAPAR